DPEDIRKTDRKVKELFPDDAQLNRWLDLAGERIAFQGLPARICWLGLGQRHRAGLAFNAMVASGEIKAPIVIGRDHLDTGSVASPNRETEGMADGSDAVSDWQRLNALANATAPSSTPTKIPRAFDCGPISGLRNSIGVAAMRIRIALVSSSNRLM